MLLQQYIIITSDATHDVIVIIAILLLLMLSGSTTHHIMCIIQAIIIITITVVGVVPDVVVKLVTPIFNIWTRCFNRKVDDRIAWFLRGHKRIHQGRQLRLHHIHIMIIVVILLYGMPSVIFPIMSLTDKINVIAR